MKYPFLLTMTVLSLVAGRSALAGDKVGNGGVGLGCKDSQGRIVSVEMLDLFEGTVERQLTYPENATSLEKEIQRALQRAKAHKPFSLLLPQMIERIRARTRMLPAGVELELTDDALPAFRKKGCDFVQVANYREDGYLYIDSVLYAKMNPLHRATLLVHEAVYALARMYNEATNSKGSRSMTYLLMANENVSKDIAERAKQYNFFGSPFNPSLFLDCASPNSPLELSFRMSSEKMGLKKLLVFVQDQDGKTVEEKVSTRGLETSGTLRTTCGQFERMGYRYYSAADGAKIDIDVVADGKRIHEVRLRLMGDSRNDFPNDRHQASRDLMRWKPVLMD